MNPYPPTNQPAIDELFSRGWLRSLEWFADIDSTNSAARRALQAKQPSPVLIVADRQSAGRGRSDHRWWSPQGCLMMTLAIPAELLPANPGDWGQLALVCGIAVAEACGRCVDKLHCELKWPNDVYVKGRKLAGILIESAGTIAEPHWLIGIGLNVEIDWSTAPDSLASRATCLSREAGHAVKLGVVLIEVVQCLEAWIVGWGRGERFWLDSWHERCVLAGKFVRLRVPGRAGPVEIVGRCHGLDNCGHLLVDAPAGLQAFSSAEVVSWQ